MKTYDYKILEEKFKQLPPHMQEALSSVEVSDTLKAIGKRHNLNLDQESIMFDLTSYVMLNLLPSNEFVENFAKEAELDQKSALAVAEDINKEVFGQVRTSMQTVEKQTKEDTAISDIEQYGGFKVEPSLADDSSTGEKLDVTAADKDSILEGIENPPPMQETRVPKFTGPLSGSTSQTVPTATTTAKTEPMVDHLLKNPVTAPMQKIERKAYTSDPYHEPIK